MAPARRNASAGTRSFRTPRNLRRAAPVFAALGDDVRLVLLNRLCTRGPLSTSQLTEGAGVSRQAVTKHLEVLERAGVVRSTHVGRERVWEVDPLTLQSTQSWLEAIAMSLDRAMARLKALMER
jgi:DNA-binding transcriptional ArsR family regulator